jgi:lysophospholipase L1-like esterase
MTGPRKFFYALFSALVGLIVIFIATESYLRIALPINLAQLTNASQTHNPMSEWAFINPFASYSPRPGYDSKLNKSVNKMGFISTPEMESVSKPKGRIRIAFLGGSSTAGTGVLLPDRATWPYQTWLKLKEKFPKADIEMINAGVNGYTSFESYGRLWSQVRFFDPDIVIVYHAWNEMYYFDDASPERLIHRAWKGDRDWKFDIVTVPPRMNPLPPDRYLGWSQLYARARAKTGLRTIAQTTGEIGASERKPDSELADSYDARGIEVFRQNLLMMKNICDLIGAEFYVMKQATLITTSLPQVLRDERCFTWYHKFNYQTHLRAFADIHRMIDNSFPPARVIDATPLSGSPDLIADHVHPTPDGCVALAKIVVEKLSSVTGILK